MSDVQQVADQIRQLRLPTRADNLRLREIAAELEALDSPARTSGTDERSDWCPHCCGSRMEGL